MKRECPHEKSIEFHTRSSHFYFPEKHLAPSSGHFPESNINNHDVWWKSRILRENEITNENSSTSFWRLILKRFKDFHSSTSSLVSRCSYWSLHGWFFPISGHIMSLFKISSDWHLLTIECFGYYTHFLFSSHWKSSGSQSVINSPNRYRLVKKSSYCSVVTSKFRTCRIDQPSLPLHIITTSIYSSNLSILKYASNTNVRIYNDFFLYLQLAT